MINTLKIQKIIMKVQLSPKIYKKYNQFLNLIIKMQSNLKTFKVQSSLKICREGSIEF